MTTSTPDPESLAAVLERTRRAAEAYGRPDLVERLVVSASVGRALPMVVVLGEYKQGKTALVDALLGEPLLPASAEADTQVVAAVVAAHPRQVLGIPVDEAPVLAIDLGELSGVVTGAVGVEGLSHLEVRTGHDRPRGVALVDTPGAAGWGSAAGAAALGWLPAAVGAVVAHDAGQPLTRNELELVQAAAALTPLVTVALTRVDLHRSWREVVDLVRDQLDGAGLGAVEVVATSAALATAGEEERGIGALAAWIDRLGVELAAGRVAAATCARVADELVDTFRAERAVLAAPPDERAAAVPPVPPVAWTTVLGDGVVDLDAVIQAEVAGRQRRRIRDVEDAIEASDPARSWAQLEQGLREDTVRDALEAFTAVRDHARRLAATVADAVPCDPADFVALVDGGAGGDLDGRLDAVAVEARIDLSRKLASRGVGALRATYSGMMLAGMLTGLIGVSLATPALVITGVVLGSKTIKEERAKQLAQRRQQARTAARRYIDEVYALLADDLTDLARIAQRDLRDLAATRAEEAEATRQRLAAAAVADEATRVQRLADVEAELERLDRLAARIRALGEAS